MTKSIKLIGLDLDGTVLTNQKQITEKTIKAISSAIDQGIIVVPVTGRPKDGLPEEFLAIPGIRYAITSNGATTYDLNTNNILFENHLPASNCLDILERLSHYDIIIEVFWKGLGYIEPHSLNQLFSLFQGKPIYSYLEKTRRSVENLIHFISNDNKNMEGISIMTKSLADKLTIMDLLNEMSDIHMVSLSTTDLEINHITCDKGTALISLGEKLGISKKSIMACGDGGNDIGLLQSVGFSVAMGNADNHLKEISSYITKTNEENGVAYAIEKFALNLI